MATPDTNSSAPVLTWRAPEFYFYPKDANWYIILIVSAVALSLYFIFSSDRSWTTIALIVVAVLALWRNANHKPRNIAIRIQAEGITVGNTFTPFTDLVSFHLTYHGEYTTVDCQRKGYHMPVSALTGEQDPNSIRATLGKYLPEKTTETDYISDRIGRFFRF